ncbi:U-box domain-containing protein [Drosera capensis]
MAKQGVVVVEGEAAMKAMELKRELSPLMKAIVLEEGDSILDTIDRAQESLAALRSYLKAKQATATHRSSDGRGVEVDYHDSVGLLSSCPEQFRCPLSKQLMRHPVVIATGQTYDRPFIEKWLNSGKRTCPQTDQLLSHTLLAPNHLIKDMISDWHESRRFNFSGTTGSVNSFGLSKSDGDRLLLLLDELSLEQKKAAAKELRLITKRNPSFRARRSCRCCTEIVETSLGEEYIA